MSVPTIGIEIELPWPTMLRRVDEEAAQILANCKGFWGLPKIEQDRVQVGFDLLDEQYKDLVVSKYGDDIAAGNDGFAEFALRPKHEYQELVVVTEDLFASGILCEGDQYPLHVTLGDVPLAKSAWLILMCMQFTGGTTPERIVQTKTWDRKGLAGILERKPAEMQLGSTIGFEMRTLALTSEASLERTLRIAQNLGGVMMSKLADDKDAQTRWRDVYQFMMQKSQEKEIDATYQWLNPSDDITPWKSVSEALIDAEWQQSIQDTLYEMV